MTLAQTQQPRLAKKKEYDQPEGSVARFLWRLWMRIAATFALSMLETWEIILIFVLVGSVTVLISFALVRCITHAIAFASFASRRAHYPLTHVLNKTVQPGEHINVIIDKS